MTPIPSWELLKLSVSSPWIKTLSSTTKFPSAKEYSPKKLPLTASNTYHKAGSRSTRFVSAWPLVGLVRFIWSEVWGTASSTQWKSCSRSSSQKTRRKTSLRTKKLSTRCSTTLSSSSSTTVLKPTTSCVSCSTTVPADNFSTTWSRSSEWVKNTLGSTLLRSCTVWCTCISRTSFIGTSNQKTFWLIMTVMSRLLILGFQRAGWTPEKSLTRSVEAQSTCLQKWSSSVDTPLVSISTLLGRCFMNLWLVFHHFTQEIKRKSRTRLLMRNWASQIMWSSVHRSSHCWADCWTRIPSSDWVAWGAWNKFCSTHGSERSILTQFCLKN